MNAVSQLLGAFALGNPTLAAQIALEGQTEELASFLPPGVQLPEVGAYRPNEAMAVALKGTPKSILIRHAEDLRNSSGISAEKKATIQEALGRSKGDVDPGLRRQVQTHLTVYARLLEEYRNQAELGNQGENEISDRIRERIDSEFREIFLRQPNEVLDILFELMHAPHEDKTALRATELAIFMSEHSPLVFNRILTDWPKQSERNATPYYEDFAVNLSVILGLRREDPQALAVLNRLQLDHPYDHVALDGIRKEDHTKPQTLDIQARPGRDHFLVAAVSDIHHSLHTREYILDIAERLKTIEPDILIVAGDLAEDLDHFEEALDLLQGSWQTLVIAGNHDVRSPWGMNLRKFGPRKHIEGLKLPTSEELWETVLPGIVAKAGAIWLENRPVIIPSAKLAIAGTIGWYDYSGDEEGRGPEELGDSDVKSRFSKDDSYVDWEWDDASFASIRRHWIHSVLTTLSENPEVQEILVATHMVPFNELKSPDLFEGTSAAYFKGRAPYYFVPSLGETLALFPKVRRTVNGHLHHGNTVLVERERMSPIEASIIAQSDTHHPKQYNEIKLMKFKV